MSREGTGGRGQRDRTPPRTASIRVPREGTGGAADAVGSFQVGAGCLRDHQPDVCQICLEEEGEDEASGSMMKPCACQTVHRSCLTKFRTTSGYNKNLTHCSACKEKYEYYDENELPMLKSESKKRIQEKADKIYEEIRYKRYIFIAQVLLITVVLTSAFGYLAYRLDSHRWILSFVELLFMSVLHSQYPHSSAEWKQRINDYEQGWSKDHHNFMLYYGLVGLWFTCVFIHIYSLCNFACENACGNCNCGGCCGDTYAYPYFYQPTCIYCDPYMPCCDICDCCGCCEGGGVETGGALGQAAADQVSCDSCCAGGCDGESAVVMIPLMIVVIVMVMVGAFVIVMYDVIRVYDRMVINFDQQLRTAAGEQAGMIVREYAKADKAKNVPPDLPRPHDVQAWRRLRPPSAYASRTASSSMRFPEEQVMGDSYRDYGAASSSLRSPFGSFRQPLSPWPWAIPVQTGRIVCLADPFTVTPADGYKRDPRDLVPGKRYRVERLDGSGGSAIATVVPVDWKQKNPPAEPAKPRLGAAGSAAGRAGYYDTGGVLSREYDSRSGLPREYYDTGTMGRYHSN